MSKKTFGTSAIAVLLILSAIAIADQQAEPPRVPERADISGRLIDLTCATRSHALTGKWGNVGRDHPHPGAETEGGVDCARMCLKGGQPAALFDGEKIVAILMCNARTTLSDFAAEEVDLRGYWSNLAAKTFVPQKIRPADGDWQQVSCATMY